MNLVDWYVLGELERLAREGEGKVSHHQRWHAGWLQRQPSLGARFGVWLGERLILIGQRMRGFGGAEATPHPSSAKDLLA